MDKQSKIRSTADRIVELGNEVEASGHAAVDAPTVQLARKVIHDWIDGARGVVVNPAFGRVTVIDEHGAASSIASADLAFKLIAAGITQVG